MLSARSLGLRQSAAVARLASRHFTSRRFLSLRRRRSFAYLLTNSNAAELANERNKDHSIVAWRLWKCSRECIYMSSHRSNT